MVERAFRIELAGIDRFLHRADVHLGIVAGEDVVEAALRQPHVERHLAAFEAVDRHARARLGALLTAPGSLAEAGADSAANAHAALAGALIVSDFVEFHGLALAFAFVAHAPFGAMSGVQAASSTRTRCCTFLTWPRTSGVSSTSI